MVENALIQKKKTFQPPVFDSSALLSFAYATLLISERIRATANTELFLL